MVYLLRLRDNTCNYVRTLGERESNGCRGKTDAGHSYQCGRLLLAGRHGNEMVHFGKGIRVPAQFRAPWARCRLMAHERRSGQWQRCQLIHIEQTLT
jgi:hypothetical protein